MSNKCLIKDWKVDSFGNVFFYFSFFNFINSIESILIPFLCTKNIYLVIIYISNFLFLIISFYLFKKAIIGKLSVA